MATPKSSADCVRTLVLVCPRNTMIYRPSTLKSVPFDSDPFSSATDVGLLELTAFLDKDYSV